MASALFSAILHKSRNFTSTFLLSKRCCSTDTNPRNIFSRISPLGDPSINVVPVLDKWLEEGNAVDGLQLQRIIKHLRSRNRFTQALQVSEWMSSKGLCPISSGDQAVQLDLIGRVRGLDIAESYFQNLSGKDKTEKLHGALLNCYVREGLVDKSLSQMQKMKDMGFASPLNYNNIMCLYTRTGQLEKVPGVLTLMKEDGVSPDIVSYRICINSYGARSDIVSMEKLLEEMEKERHIGSVWMTYSTVANIYIKAGLKEKALICLKKCEDKVDKRNTIAYNYLISHYASLGNKNAMMRLWKLQKANCKKQLNREYITMLGSLVKLGDLDHAENLLAEWELSGNCYDFRVPNILLIGYSQRGLIEKAETMLRSMVEKGKTPTPDSWAIIASGYVAKENMEKAFQCMKEAAAVQTENKGWRPKPNVISSILNWVTINRGIDEVEDFVNSLKTVISLNRDMYLSLIKIYVRCGKEVDRILEIMKADNIELDEEIEEILNMRL
ncbi:pentatricopeptide repeat-containing protein At4g21705, mitochondrial-like [Gastrolobium bilobum]|uniref:pentatricopeptide repeat-containing protein At4g21705, mitochondrial-like n=1 Tax=Gastrolobium bilobum TaxID=150636 RepID=UPI002AB0D39C|nr:pentatricopeptide repeat-containing protein At4g21705, mitochondrial-like [Gastrolobium bilobum]